MSSLSIFLQFGVLDSVLGPSAKDKSVVKVKQKSWWGIVEPWTKALVYCDKVMPRIGGWNLHLVSVFYNSTLISFASGARPRALAGDHYAT